MLDFQLVQFLSLGLSLGLPICLLYLQKRGDKVVIQAVIFYSTILGGFISFWLLLIGLLLGIFNIKFSLHDLYSTALIIIYVYCFIKAETAKSEKHK